MLTYHGEPHAVERNLPPCNKGRELRKSDIRFMSVKDG